MPALRSVGVTLGRVKAEDVLVVLVVAPATFLLVDVLQPITFSCVSHGEPNCERMQELFEAARAQRSLLLPLVASGLAGLFAYLVTLALRVGRYG